MKNIIPMKPEELKVVVLGLATATADAEGKLLLKLNADGQYYSVWHASVNYYFIQPLLSVERKPFGSRKAVDKYLMSVKSQSAKGAI